MRRQDFIDYRNKHYVSSATTVIVAGKIDEKGVFKKVSNAFRDIGKWKKEGKEKVIENQKQPQATVYFKDTDQTHIVLGVRTFNTYNKYNSIIRLIEAILSGGMSSRLFQKMRDEMGICYYVRADNEALTDHGVFAVSAGLDSKRVKEGIVAILNELKKIKTEIISKEELDKAKQYLIGNLYLGLESSDSLATFYGYQEVLRKDLKKPEDVVKEIKAVTAEEIKFVAEKIFKDESLNLSMVGKFTDKKEFLEILKL
jgi:predicted Zn-dependent peptidase